MTGSAEIRVPKGIRFDCSGCGNCCLEWPVPLTSNDYERISTLPVELKDKAVTRSLKSSRENLLSFTHTLEKNNDKCCPFFTNDKLCQLHLEFGAQSKPSMCRLFPYSFIVTPDTVLATLSFASSAVLYNTGKLLSEQSQVLLEQYKLFQMLFNPDLCLWHKVQLIDGQPLNWGEFKELDRKQEKIIEDQDSNECSQNLEDPPENLPAKLKAVFNLALRELDDTRKAEQDPPLEARPKIVDQVLLKFLDRLYFPEQVFAAKNYDLECREMLKEMVAAPQTVSFGSSSAPNISKALVFSDLIKNKLGKLPADAEDLLNRFLYVRYFSKTYFGPGFHNLSLISGLNHLRTLYILLRLKVKEKMLLENVNPDFELLAELVRSLERRLTQLDLSKESQAILEVLMTSPERQNRFSFLAE